MPSGPPIQRHRGQRRRQNGAHALEREVARRLQKHSASHTAGGMAIRSKLLVGAYALAS
jgi:hypothetical protein